MGCLLRDHFSHFLTATTGRRAGQQALSGHGSAIWNIGATYSVIPIHNYVIKKAQEEENDKNRARRENAQLGGRGLEERQNNSRSIYETKIGLGRRRRRGKRSMEIGLLKRTAGNNIDTCQWKTGAQATPAVDFVQPFSNGAWLWFWTGLEYWWRSHICSIRK